MHLMGHRSTNQHLHQQIQQCIMVGLLLLSYSFWVALLWSGFIKTHSIRCTVKRHNVCKCHVAIIWHLFQTTEGTIFLHLFQWDKKCNCFQGYFWRNKLVSKFWKLHLTRTNIAVSSVISVLLSHNTYSDKYWSNFAAEMHTLHTKK